MTNVYFNHDGGVDDLVSLLLLLQMPEARVTGVSVVDGDCQIEAALEASRKIIDLFGGKQAALELRRRTLARIINSPRSGGAPPSPSMRCPC